MVVTEISGDPTVLRLSTPHRSLKRPGSGHGPWVPLPFTLRFQEGAAAAPSPSSSANLFRLLCGMGPAAGTDPPRERIQARAEPPGLSIYCSDLEDKGSFTVLRCGNSTGIFAVQVALASCGADSLERRMGHRITHCRTRCSDEKCWHRVLFFPRCFVP